MDRGWSDIVATRAAALQRQVELEARRDCEPQLDRTASTQHAAAAAETRAIALQREVERMARLAQHKGSQVAVTPPTLRQRCDPEAALAAASLCGLPSSLPPPALPLERCVTILDTSAIENACPSQPLSPPRLPSEGRQGAALLRSEECCLDALLQLS
mmetsp:Transcript_29009/g.96327  ORF Transcript_29009/g.96327 Transcript_29009/m.96327 type:complete len:158 (+) Transcript_29009:91-564(+)